MMGQTAQKFAYWRHVGTSLALAALVVVTAGGICGESATGPTVNADDPAALATAVNVLFDRHVMPTPLVLHVDPSSWVFLASATNAANAAIKDADLRWTSSNPAVLSVESTANEPGIETPPGVTAYLRARAAGSAVITVTSGSGLRTASGTPISRTFTVTVVASPPVRWVTTPAAVSVRVGDSALVTSWSENAAGQRIDSYQPNLFRAFGGLGVFDVGIPRDSLASAYGVYVIGRRAGVDTLTVTGRRIGAGIPFSTAETRVLVTVTPVPTAVVFAPASRNPSLFVGESIVLGASAQDASGAVAPGVGITYRLRNTADAAYVSLNGVTGQFTATSLEQATRVVEVEATGSDGARTLAPSTSLVTIRSRVARVDITPTSATLGVGSSISFVAAATRQAGAPTSTTLPAARWTSSDPTRVSIDAATGVARALAPTAAGAPVTITATIEGVGATAPVTVPAAAAPTIVVTPRSGTLLVGQSMTLTAAVSNGTAPITVSFVSRNTAVATVAPPGTTNPAIISAADVGSTYVVASYTLGAVTVRDSAAITVVASGSTSRVRNIVLESRSAEITAPAGLSFRVMFFDSLGVQTTVESGGLLQFVSSNTGVATIDVATGRAAGVAGGTTVITARYLLSGAQVASDVGTLTVYPAGTAGYYGSVEISTASNLREVRVGHDVLFQVIVRDAAGNQLTSGVTGLSVTSSDPTRLEVVTSTGGPPGFFYVMRGKALTTAGNGANPLGGAVRIIADGPGIHSEIFVRVVPP